MKTFWAISGLMRVRPRRKNFALPSSDFSVWMTEQASAVPEQYLAANPDLHGSTPMQVYDACVTALTRAGLIVHT